MPDTPTNTSVTVISRYSMPNHRQDALSHLFESQLKEWICRRPGFITGSVLRSIDEAHVVVCTTWLRVNDGVNFMSCDEGKRMFAALSESGATQRESFTYHAGTTISPATER